MDTPSTSTNPFTDPNNDKYSIKNLLFTKAVPNYVIPIPTDGYKVYACIDCGDKFTMETSYKCHVNRKSAKITYFCRHCNELKNFYNRCNMLSHLRHHAFKTATINISDLKIEPLPMTFYNIPDSPLPVQDTIRNQSTKCVCHECQTPIIYSGSMSIGKARAQHFMQVSKKNQKCIVCLHVLPTTCALKAHMRLHLKYPPYYCPECGLYLTSKILVYPYPHGCEGFKMMRATARIKCPVTGCQLLHPSEYREHIKITHLKEVFKCNLCYLASFEAKVVIGHLKREHPSAIISSFYQCELCTGRLVMSNQVNYHINGHISSMVQVYPCWSCGGVCKDAENLLEHNTSVHDENTWNLFCSILPPARRAIKCKDKNYRVVKKCGQCKRSFTYKCKYEQIASLPNECPYKCSFESGTKKVTSDSPKGDQIVCHICKHRIPLNWEQIKNHYNEHHKEHRCVDVKVDIQRMNFEKYIKVQNKKTLKRLINKRAIRKGKRKYASSNNHVIKDYVNHNKDGSTLLETNAFHCKKCGHQSENQELFENHLLTHRDLCMAYQCMECGECFVVKPSFSKHLLIEHNILNVDDYILEKHCYNENALDKYQEVPISNEPLLENQCTICREQFENSSDLEKHFRVHGMAFIMKKRNNSP